LPPAQECVTTHPPKRFAPKTKDAPESRTSHPFRCVDGSGDISRVSYKAGTQSCRGIPRCLPSLFPSGFREGAEMPFRLRPRPKPPWTQIWVAVAAIRSKTGTSVKPVGRPECGEGFPANSRCAGVSRP